MSPSGAAGSGQRFGGPPASPLPLNWRKHGVPTAASCRPARAVGNAAHTEAPSGSCPLSSAPRAASTPARGVTRPSVPGARCRGEPSRRKSALGVGDGTDLLRPRHGLPRAAPGRALRRSHGNIAGPAARGPGLALGPAASGMLLPPPPRQGTGRAAAEPRGGGRSLAGQSRL